MRPILRQAQPRTGRIAIERKEKMNRRDWNPELYLKFEEERTKPSVDLVSRIGLDHPKKIIDIGCGPGNSTQILAQRYPQATITGIDNSPSMIDKARKDYPHQEWIILDAGKDDIRGTFDIVFSNAAIQWIPDHGELLKKFHHLLNEQGQLAVQMPLFWDMPLGQAIAHVAKESRWPSATQGATELFTIHDCSFYFDHLSPLFRSVDIWETHYVHIMDSHLSILEMIRSTGLRPYLDRLENERDKKDLEESVLVEIAKDYPLQKNGKVLFAF